MHTVHLNEVKDMGFLMTALISLVIAYLLGTIFLYQKKVQDMTASVESLVESKKDMHLALEDANDDFTRLAKAINRLADNTVK